MIDTIVPKSHLGYFLHIFVPYDHLVDEDFEDPENDIECIEESLRVTKASAKFVTVSTVMYVGRDPL